MLEQLRSEIQTLKESQTNPMALIQIQQELSGLITRVDKNEDRIDETADKLEKLEESVKLDRTQTIHLLADHCERHDFQSNVAKSHCVLLTGRGKLYTIVYTLT
jgi:hypothetical protein